MTDEQKKGALKERILIEQLRRFVKEHHFTRTNLVTEEINKIESGLRNLLFTLAIFLFTFTSPIFIESKGLPEIVKLLLFLSWIFLFSSMIFGLIQIVIDIKFLSKSGEIENKAEKLWSTAFIGFDEYEKRAKEGEELFEDFDTHSPYIPLIQQVVFLLIAFLLIMSGASLLLFGK
ncbi:hypothetical protein KKC08_02800 [Patescibacteria group bacterium]|nr:hypothetical protein [Patescibacteria group bacterium]MCG2701820.1 hypothetical protein [Candidatus Parcubacteria bacterium]MBU4265227.1 hypothetical protein [Patescibacteria group bacterium]MBU4390296.1 hypothetical protein [Patescibacteria group bacterium]MBU4397067.1 hypothetical protein [Patescibacteria group bacterium]